MDDWPPPAVAMMVAAAVAASDTAPAVRTIEVMDLRRVDVADMRSDSCSRLFGHTAGSEQPGGSE
ncbi:hypothetical protein C5E51_20715 [Nocardia nova]|uniref:Uncharacterized protein n=1 Tax=Nocardia nova TaxID=37330 RepID=A0A2S6A615_9NOCA|nr:hypothetical protein C5E51_20715 [Nocardia nova]PPJ27736.1 hypothetical protein C5F51_17135 [Nocardia nova]